MDIQSKEVIDKISRDLKVQPSLQIPRGLAKQIELSYNVNPEREIEFVNSSIADGTAVTIKTTSTTKDTFIIGATMTISKDVVNSSIFTGINATAFGKNERLLFTIRYEPLTAGSVTESIFFPIPIKLAPGTIIQMTNTNGTASIDSTATIFIYEVDRQ